MPRRRRSNLIRNGLLVITLAIFLLMGLSPLLESLLTVPDWAHDWLEWTRSRVMETLVAVWFFVFGSMVGSFINVVVWRMPRGVSVVSRGSACPYCQARIRLADNIPVFGWIKLGGRCRVCRLPISPRYPIVEAVFGLVFLLMFFVELQSAGANLPGGQRYISRGILQVIVSTKWDLILIYVFHMTLLVMLMTWSLMAWDGSRIPVKTVSFALLVGFAVPWFFPYVHPVPWIDDADQWFTEFPWLQRTVTAFLGLACGFIIGSLLQAMLDGTASPGSRDGLAVTVALATIGLFTGWQLVTYVVLQFGILISLRDFGVYSKRMPACGWLTLATLMAICFWRRLEVPDHGPASWLEMGCAASWGLLLTWVASRLHRGVGSSSLQSEVRA